MNEYNPKRSSSWNYGGNNWKLSRSKIDLFKQCPRCFYIDNKLGTKRPSIPAFMINSAVDYQLKQEFDVHRAKDTQHPLQKEYGIDAKPVSHEKINEWRENFEGIQYLHKPTGILVSGAIDDLWINGNNEYIVVDYKATARNNPIAELDNESKYHDGYKRQIEVYQWLLRRNELKVSDTGYFVYCTGKYDQKAFDKKIEFDVALIPYTGNDSWVEPTINEIKECLESDEIPKSGEGCEHCAWWYARNGYEK
ncbi:PD-(D/E)XK nuclease family protein [Candidatus Parcubacteria bacterium]|nr:PD-(D/E)XK nuclease family protein [Candidatus Parcubacteria bacterium]